MPKSLEKTRKKITKKKGNISALHENSRDSQRLRRAGMRDEKLERVARGRKKNDKPLLTRAKFFQAAVKENAQPLEIEAVRALIESFVHQYDEEFNQLKKERRAGRAASTREDVLRIKIALDEKEWENGFYMPDLTDAVNVAQLLRWEGSWAYLSTVKWVRITKAGNVQSSSFPPKGDN